MRSISVLRSLRASVALAIVAALSACTAFEEMNSSTPSPTGGVTMVLSIARPDQQTYELYRVTRRGEIEFGGGMNAFNDTTTWRGSMTEEQIARFLGLLDEIGWCESGPESDPASSVRVRIELRCTERRRTISIRGTPESVVRMRNLLDPIARERFGPDLDRLPEASDRRTMTRGAPAQDRASSASPVSPASPGAPATGRTTPENAPAGSPAP